MIKKISDYFKVSRPLIFYPWLILILFIVKKFDLINLHPSWGSILIFLSANIIVLFIAFKILKLFTRDRLKTWLLAAILLLLLLYYSKIIEFFSRLPFLQKVLASLPALLHQLFFILLYILIIYLSTKYKGSLVKLSIYLNYLFLALILYISVAIFSQKPNKITLANKLEITQNRQSDIGKKLPDIYYIILDAYTSNKSLKDYWNYDNVELTDFLKSKGFRLETGSRTNYNITEYSLCSTLNMSYLANIPGTRSENPVRILNLKNLIRNSQVIRFAVKNGYRITNLSFFDLPETPRYYDDFYTIGRDLLDGTSYKGVLKRLTIDWNNASSHNKIFSLEKINPGILNKLKIRDKNDTIPNFIYAHIMMPHDPYLFDEFGRIHENDSVFISTFKDLYLGQLKYANKLIISTLDSIIKNYSSTPLVIIIQGDHGYRYLTEKNKMDESMTILNAYYFSDHSYSDIYNSISPVNTFRVVFNKYLNAGFPLIRDTSYNVFYESQ